VAAGEIGIGRVGSGGLEDFSPVAWVPGVMLSDDPARLAAQRADPGRRAARVAGLD
jgi:hypothetical protein